MYIRTGISRNEIPALLNAEASAEGIRDFHPKLISSFELSKGIVALWGDYPKPEMYSPAALVIEERETREFLAYVWTYLPDLRPLTAITRLLDIKSFEAALSLSETPSLGRTRNAWLGLMYAEVLSGQSSDNIFRITQTDCLSTTTFAQARARALGYGSSVIAQIRSRWVQLQSMLTQFKQNHKAVVPEEFWRLLYDLDGSNRYDPLPLFEGLQDGLVGTLNEYQETGRVGADSWSVLTQDRPSARAARVTTDAPREQRVLAFEAVYSEIAESRARRDGDSFILAYLASQVSPGSMDHIALLRTAPPELRASYFWYGMLAGLAPGSTVHSAYEGLGRRVLRDLTRPESIYERPYVDVDLLELLMAGESSRPDSIKGALPEVLSVSLLPCVSSLVQLTRGSGAGADAAVVRSSETLEQMRKLERSLMDTQYAYERLSRSLGVDSQRQIKYQRLPNPRRK